MNEAAIRILIVDDDAAVSQTVKQILEFAGFSVLQAEDGKRALEIIQETSINLVLTDIMMPNKDGIELILEMQKTSPAIPIVAMSGGGRTRNLDFLKFAKELGANRVLEKPFQHDQLLSVVKEALASA